MNKNINISILADKVANGKWLLSPTAYTTLAKTVENYINYKPVTMVKEMKDTDNSFKVDSESNNEQGSAVINIHGILVKGASEEECEEFGLCNIDFISEALDEAANDSTVEDIYLCFSSPGGETTGIDVLGRKIAYINDNIKPVCGWVEFQASSAAYWLISQCGIIGMTTSAEVGSIGVYSLIEDCTKQLDKEGIYIEAIVAGKHKLIGHTFHTLTEEEKNILQNDVNTTYEEFKAAITARRSIKDEFLQGLSYSGKIAVTIGFADELHESFEDFLTKHNTLTNG